MKLISKIPYIIRIRTKGETPRILRKLWTDAREKIKVKITDKSLLDYLKKRREKVEKALKEERIPKRLAKKLRKERKIIRLLEKDKKVFREWKETLKTYSKVRIRMKGRERVLRVKNYRLVGDKVKIRVTRKDGVKQHYWYKVMKKTKVYKW